MNTEQWFVNLGRWADGVIGPFTTEGEAQTYADGLNYNGVPPKVVKASPPKTAVMRWTVPFTSGDARIEVKVAAKSQTEAVNKAKALVGHGHGLCLFAITQEEIL